jgi:hypothetical protein
MKPFSQFKYLPIGLIFLINPVIIFAQSSPTYSVFLIGDAGEPNLNSDNSVLRTLQIQIKETGKNSSVIFLGDNIYPKGLVRINESGRKEAEQALIQQLNVLKNYEGKPFIIPGNHDWQQGGKNGWEYVKNQEKFVSDYLQNNDVFYPKEGCPTPHEVSLNQNISLVLLDTQWWLHAWDKPELHSDCEVKTLEDILGMVNDILERNQHKKVLVLGHHPMYSHGSHGGYFTAKDHLTPFHELGLPIPLPILGSIYPLYRSLIGDIQDIAHPKYRQMRDGLVKLFKQYPNALYASGHEHNLQLIVRDSINYIVSGAGSKHTPVKYGRDSKFAKSTKGFARLDFYEDKTVMTFWEGDGQHGKELFSTILKISLKNPALKTNFVGKIASEGIIPNPNYRVSSFKKWLLGNNYRDVWATPIQTNFLNFQTQENGLRVIQKGGGFQTLSLRYVNQEGLQFVTRSVEKYPSKAIPESIRSDFTEDIVTDQISASHPYAALVVAQLAKSAGILHTNPQLVIIPDDTCLHDYKRLFANQLALFEERPDGDFAGSKKIQSTQKLIEKLAEDSNNSVDEQAVIKARIFDMWIGDWDRHDDQWRWAGYENGKGLIYKPIPRDRDQAFFVNEGLLPKIVSRKWIFPKLQGFDYKIRDVPGLAFNARYFDRSFITQSSREAWIENAKNLQQNMTDEVIDEAVTHFPNLPEYSKIIAEKLKTRRNDLVGYTEQLYNFLSRNVDVLGSNKDEIFKVKRLSEGETEVSIFAKKKNNEEGKRIYHRIFNPAITKEIRLYGLEGEDNFVVSGLAKKGIKVRLIGGEGKDSFTDSSNVKGCQKKTVVYDKIEDSSLEIGTETANKLSNKNEVNEYNREAFNYDKLTPIASFAFNPDDGIFIGTGIQWTKQGFRKKPFESQQSISGNVAFGTGSYNVFYKGEFTDIVGKIDFVLKATIQQGGLVDNFFGLSNKSKYEQEKGIDFYRIRFENQSFQGLFKNQFGKLTIFSGVTLDTWEIKKNPTRFINEFAINNPEIYNRKKYLGIKSGFTFDNRNNTIFPTHGILWNLETNIQKGLNESVNKDFINLKTDISLYYTFKLPAIVSVATRFGGGINFTDFELFQANSLGGLSNLRGFRRTRFSGKSSFYNNTEMRVKVMNVKSYLFPAYLGVLAFHDVGRVCSPDEKSELWHQGYGLGLWFSPFNLFVVSTTYGKSKEDEILTIKAGLFF